MFLLASISQTNKFKILENIEVIMKQLYVQLMSLIYFKDDTFKEN
jgi:hypothetical protein